MPTTATHHTESGGPEQSTQPLGSPEPGNWFSRAVRRMFPQTPPEKTEPAESEGMNQAPYGEDAALEEDINRMLSSYSGESRAKPLTEHDLDQLDRLSPRCRELWTRIERMSDEEAVHLFETLDPLKNPDWMTAVSQNLSRRFMLDHRKTPRPQKNKRPRNGGNGD